MMTVSPIPDGCNSVSAYLIVGDARAALEFYAKAFGGTSACCLETPDGSVMHGEVRIGNSTVMLSQENPAWGLKSAETMGGSPVSLHVYTDDCDAMFQQAIDAGCKEVSPIEDTFWGDRFGKVIDPFGLQWSIATQTEVVDAEEMQRRGTEWFQQMANADG